MHMLTDIKTIADEDDVQCYSEESNAEAEFQPSKQKTKQKIDFNTDFTFASTIEEYNKDVWNDLTKYVKRKAKTKTDDKIKKARLEIKDDADVQEEEEDVQISDDELKFDTIKVKERKRKQRRRQQEQEEFFEQGDIVHREMGSFYEMNLSRPLMKAIASMKFVHPTPIQASTIPIALLGRDICGCAATGTGKTAAYMLPTLERLLFRPADTATTRVLVLVPTRELGVQVYQVSKQLAQHTNIEIALAVGGLDVKTQESLLRKHPDIVIATPGRLIDHLKSTPSFALDAIEVLILDEADRMLDEYFQEQMREIIKQCSRTRQTMLFSATMTDEVNDLVAVSLRQPVKLFANSNQEVAFNLRQEFVRIRDETEREAYLAALVCRTFRRRCIIFVQTKKQAHRLHIQLGLLGVRVVELHGNLTQPQRLDALAKFRAEEADVMVATDVAARGLDITGVETVVNYVMPATIEHYIHRVGRTARAGRAGVSVSLAGESERKIVKEIIKKATNPVKSRLIPPDILQKYNNKLQALESSIEKIIQDEYAERMLAKAENQANRAQKALAGEKNAQRPWFQNKTQRKQEKDRLALVPKVKKAEPEKKQTKKAGKNSKPAGSDELTKVTLLQARMAKRSGKMQKIKTCVESATQGTTKNRAKKSSFDVELTDTSAKNAKKLRYNANIAIRNKAKGSKSKPGKPVRNNNKVFARPSNKKKRN